MGQYGNLEGIEGVPGYTIYEFQTEEPLYRGALTGFSPIGEVFSSKFTMVIVEDNDAK